MKQDDTLPSTVACSPEKINLRGVYRQAIFIVINRDSLFRLEDIDRIKTADSAIAGYRLSK